MKKSTIICFIIFAITNPLIKYLLIKYDPIAFEIVVFLYMFLLGTNGFILITAVGFLVKQKNKFSDK